MEVLSEHEGIWGCTFVGECTKVCPKHVDPAGAIQRYKLTARAGVDEGLLHAKGGVMSDSHVYTPIIRAGFDAACPPTGGSQKWSYFAFILREGSCCSWRGSVVYLLLLVNAVRQGAGSYTRIPRVVGSNRGCWRLNVVSFLFVVFHAVTFFEAAPRALVVHIGRTRVPGRLVMRRPTTWRGF